jgi:hypothetical protein
LLSIVIKRELQYGAAQSEESYSAAFSRMTNDYAVKSSNNVVTDVDHTQQHQQQVEHEGEEDPRHVQFLFGEEEKEVVVETETQRNTR